MVPTKPADDTRLDKLRSRITRQALRAGFSAAILSNAVLSKLCCTEDMADRIGVDAVEIVRAALLFRRPGQRAGTTGKKMTVDGIQPWHHDVKVHASVLSPRRDRNVRPLEGQPRSAMRRQQNQPLIAGRIGSLMALGVGPSEKSAVELGKLARLGAVQSHFIQVERVHARP
jgi:hypothetical protein